MAVVNYKLLSPHLSRTTDWLRAWINKAKNCDYFAIDSIEEKEFVTSEDMPFDDKNWRTK